LLINWQFWRKNANHREKSIFTTETLPMTIGGGDNNVTLKH